MRSFFPRASGLAIERTRRFDRDSRPAFSGGTPPALRVVVDVQSVAPPQWGTDIATEDTSPSSLLIGLLQSDSILTLFFQDDGAPETVERRSVFGDSSWAPGWLELSRNTDHDRIAGGVRFVDADGGPCHAIIPEVDWLRLLAQMPRKQGLYPQLSDEQAVEREQADALLVFASEAAEVDILVTERPGSITPRVPIHKKVQVLTVRQALAVLGLYLRRYGAYIIARSADGSMTQRVSPLLFWRISSLGLVPDFERLHDLAHRMSRGDEYNRAAWLSFSAMERIGKALRARDQLHCTLLSPQDSDTAIVTTDALDALLVNFTGLIDTLARMADIILDIGTRKPYNVAWQKPQWLASVRQKDRILADMMDPASKHGLEFSILRGLRNCVHGEALLPFLHEEEPGNPRHTFIDAPPSEAGALIASITQCGGKEAWGLENDQSHTATFDVGKLTESLTTRILDLASQIVGRLAPIGPVNTSSSIAANSNDQREKARLELMKENFRLQLGLSTELVVDGVAAVPSPPHQ